MAAIFDQYVAGRPRASSYEFRERARRLGCVHRHGGRRWNAYAELMGASVDSILPEEEVDDLLDMWVSRQPVRYFFCGGHPQEADRKAGMERVMLAMALLGPGVLERRDGDAEVQV